MTLSLESLARTIAKAQHGTDAYWANYMPAARAARESVTYWIESLLAKQVDKAAWERVRALIAQPDGAQSGER